MNEVYWCCKTYMQENDGGDFEVGSIIEEMRDKAQAEAWLRERSLGESPEWIGDSLRCV